MQISPLKKGILWIPLLHDELNIDKSCARLLQFLIMLLEKNKNLELVNSLNWAALSKLLSSLTIIQMPITSTLQWA